jgi:hypothetical protein
MLSTGAKNQSYRVQYVGSCTAVQKKLHKRSVAAMHCAE